VTEPRDVQLGDATTRAPLGQRISNTLLGYWRYVRKEGRVTTNVIAFMLIATGLILFLIFKIFAVQPRYDLSATFAESGGVFTGQEVTYRGVTVGRVGSLKVVPDGVRIQMVIEERYNTIPKDGTKARIMFKSAVGEQFIDILPSKRSAPYFTDGDEIAKKDTVLPVQQEELLRLLDAVLSGIPPKAIGDLVDVLGEGLGGRGQELHDALAALDPLSKALSDRTAELNSLAISGDRLGSAFDETRSEFVTGIKGFGRVSSALGRGSQGLERLLLSGATYIGDLEDLVHARKADIDTTIRYLAETTRLSYDNLKSVADTLDFLPLLLDTLVQSYDAPTNRFRFGRLLAEVRNYPCSYGTPRRPSSAEGDAPYQPILEFDC
jgi:phospholipid/cholesterol/gamma-HCH transport system substrate-binding protein